MGKATAFVIVSVMMTAVWLSGVGSAALHDLDCMPAGQEGSDASNTRIGAKQLTDFTCLGEMLVGADDHDWYFIDGIVGTAGDPYTISVCPVQPKTQPWDANLEVVSKVSFGTPLPKSIGGVQYSLLTSMIEALVNDMYEVEPVGASANDGCDSVVVPGEVNSVGNPFLPNRVFIHIIRASGDGHYDLTVG